MKTSCKAAVTFNGKHQGTDTWQTDLPAMRVPRENQVDTIPCGTRQDIWVVTKENRGTGGADCVNGTIQGEYGTPEILDPQEPERGVCTPQPHRRIRENVNTRRF